MNIGSSVGVIRNDLKYFGIRPTAYDVGTRVLNRFVFYKRLQVVAVSDVRLKEQLPLQFTFRRIFAAELARFASRPDYGINPSLVDEVRQGENSCYGIFDGDKLAQYLFVFTQPTKMSEDLLVKFNRGLAYLCATFTHPDYRGLHLNSIGAALAAKEYQRRGYNTMLAYVESNNFSSLRSLHRVGWQDVGSVDIVRLFGRYFIRTSSGCGPFGFRIVRHGTEAGGDSARIAQERAS